MPAQLVSSDPTPTPTHAVRPRPAWASAGATAQPFYIYGVIEAATGAPEVAGIDDQPLRMITHQHLAAIVSELPESRLQLGRRQLQVHGEVLQRAMQRGTVLPMRFGVIMEGAEEITRELLTPHAGGLTHQLSHLQGKVELRLRAMYEEAPLMREAVQGNPEITRLRRMLSSLGERAGEYGRIRLAELVGDAVERMRSRDAIEILSRLQPLAQATATSEPSLESMALSACFLVEAAEVNRFTRAVNQLRRRQAGRLRLHYSDPLPPYSFVRLQSGEGSTARDDLWASCADGVR